MIITVILISMILSGCQNTTFGNEMSEIQNESVFETERASETAMLETSELYDEIMEAEVEVTDVTQSGPCGEISLSLPEGWKFDLCPAESGDLHSGMYGIRFYPEGVENGGVELVYTDSFGVCGTGLETKETMIAGMPVSIGTYDGNEYWGFITFQEDYEGIVVLTYFADDWWDGYGDQVLDILNTLSFDQSVKDGSE